MAITKLKHHDSHPVQIHYCKPGKVHFAALRCKLCNTHIQWLNRQETAAIKELLK